MTTKLFTTYKEIDSFIRPYFESSNLNFEKNFKISALAKSFEYNYYINKIEVSTSFFSVPTLRGLCEDIIVLKFIDEYIKFDREELLKELTLKQQINLLISQKNFFSEYKPEQIIFDFDDKETKLIEHNTRIKEIMELNGFSNKKEFPKVMVMAEKTGHLKFYDFVYRATSEFVHFSPHILLRMGWNKSKNDNISFSTNNFSTYYTFLSSFLGSFMFVKFIRLFSKDFNFALGELNKINEIENIIMSEFEYPELITLEEMNFEKASNARLINKLRAIRRNIELREQ